MSGNGAPFQMQAKPMQARPMLSGGLEQMNMLNAFRQGASWDQLNAMNPVTPRPAQFLPPALAQFDYMAQFRQQQDAARAVAQQQTMFRPHFEYATDGGDAAGGVEGSGAAGIGSGIGTNASAADAVNGLDANSDSAGGGGGGAK